MDALLWGLVGWAVGGLVAIVASRLPYGLPLGGWPPKCHACQKTLAPLDWLPVVGYLLQRGRCRHCGGALDVRLPLTEALCAATFAALWWRHGFGPLTLIGSLYAAILWLVFLIDWRHHLILNRVTYPTVLLALALSFVFPLTEPLRSLLGAVLCGGVFLGFYWLGRLLYRGRVPLGMGDVKLAVVFGAMLGAQCGFLALVLGIVAGAVQAVALLLLGQRRRTYMPYGTALVAGAVLTLIAGPDIWAWWLGR